jgi:hypothetical protein
VGGGLVNSGGDLVNSGGEFAKIWGGGGEASWQMLGRAGLG